MAVLEPTPFNGVSMGYEFQIDKMVRTKQRGRRDGWERLGGRGGVLIHVLF